VTKAVKEPRKFVLAAMDFLRTLDLRRCRLLEWSIHIGSHDGAKGPRRLHNSRDFAAVMAQTVANRRY
jgi:hypothetical protein